MIQPGVGGRRSGSGRRRRRRVPLLLVVVCSFFLPQRSAADACYRVAFDAAPLWSSNLAWRSPGWVLADPGRGELHLYSATGADEGSRIRPGQGPFEFNAPEAVAAVDDGLLLHDGNSHWLWLDAHLEPQRQLDFGESPTRDGEVLGGLYRWAATADGRVFAYLHVYQKDSTWWTGLAEVVLADPPRYRRLVDLDPSSPAAVFHTLVLQTVAVAGGKAYFLQQEDPVTVLEAPGLRRLHDAIPEPLRKPPSLPELRAETVAPFFARLAHQRAAVGLYGHGDRLFLLERDPSGGSVRWTLHEIDPAADRIVRSRVLPTRADWIVPAPGPKSWAILEKGPVEGILQQEHRALTLVPTEWIEGVASPLSGGAPPECVDGRPPAAGRSRAVVATTPSPAAPSPTSPRHSGDPR